MERPRDLTTLSDDELEQEVITWQGRISAGQHRLLMAIGEVDARRSWDGHGILSCAHWLGLKLGMASGTAHEHVRVARRLRELPVVAAEMAAGRLSFSQVRAITRVASPDTQQRWVDVAAYATGAQLDKLARGVARVKAAESGARPKPHLSWGYDDETGELVMTMRCPAEIAVPVIAALEAAMDDAYEQAKAAAASGQSSAEESSRGQSSAEDSPTDRPTREQVREAAVALLRDPGTAPPEDWRRGPSLGMTPTRMNGLLRMAEVYLAHRGASASARDRARLRVYADPLTGWSRLADGELLPPAVTAQLIKGRPVPEIPRRAADLGRLQRDATAYQRLLLETLDGACCRFPGCTRRRRLHAHHIRWWSNGGPTDIDNLVLLCSRHHTLVHEGVYHLRLLPDRTLRVFSHQTERLISSRPKPSAEPDPARLLVPEIDPGAARSKHEGDRLDLGYVSMIMCAT